MSTFSEWYQSNLGQSLLAAEKSALQKFLPSLNGEIAVQYAYAGTQMMLETSNIDHKFFLQAGEKSETGPMETAGGGEAQSIYISAQDVLPFFSSSVDLCLLSHMLDFAEYPHQLLRESKDILVSGGHLIILGFNPYSCWGGRKLFSRSKAPWNGHNFSVYKIREWLSLLDFQIVGGMMLYYSPLIKSQAMRQRFSFMEAAGDRWWPMLGSVYLLVAQKRDQGTTVIDLRENFKEDAYMNIAEPAVKSYMKIKISPEMRGK
jgi:SAM-dependent methyltransferase